MSIVNGRDFGQASRWVRVEENFPCSSTAGATNSIPLGKLPCSAENGTEYGVLALVLRVRGMTLPCATAKSFDGASLAQLISTVTIKLADGSPPSQFDGGDQIINGVDGYRALQALSFLSGEAAILVGGGNKWDLPAPTTSATQSAVIEQQYTTNSKGWLQYMGPFASAAGADYSFTSDVYFLFWVGVHKSEKWGASAIPARWFNGQKQGCAQTGTGYLSFALGSTIDNKSITLASPQQVDLYAKCITYSPAKRPFPLTPKIRAYQVTSSNFKTYRGIRQYLGFAKPLTSTGAMQTESYTRVEVKNSGTQLVESQIDLNMVDQATNASDADGYDFTLTQNTLSNRNVARYSRMGVPLLVWRERNTMTFGDALAQTDVNIITTGETTHEVLDVTLTPRTAEVDSSAREWVNDPQAVVSSVTDNGNSQNSFAATGKQMLVPGAVESPASMLQMKRG